MTVIINGDTGITSPADSLSGNLNFTGTGNRITGDFSNATLANRVAFQTSTVNGNTGIFVLPNGTSTTTNIQLSNNSDPTSSSVGIFGVVGSTDVRIQSSTQGTGTFLPMTFYTGGSERVRVDTSGNVGIGTSSPSFVAGSTGLQINGSSAPTVRLSSPTSNIEVLSATNASYVWVTSNTPLAFGTNATERARIDSSGNLLVGTTNADPIGQKVAGSSIRGTTSQLNAMADGQRSLALGRYTSTGNLAEFFYYGGSLLNVGYISTNGSTVTFSGNALSDARWKENVQPITGALSAISQLDFVTFEFKSNGQASAGVTTQQAETVEAIKPLVIKGAEEQDYNAFDYNGLIGYLGAAIQEQQAIIEQLRADVEALKAA